METAGHWAGNLKAVSMSDTQRNAKQRRWLRLYVIGTATLAAIALLAWEHNHGGIQTHHILHSAALPGFSNWWTLLLLPALAWFVVGRVERRVARHVERGATASTIPKSVWVGFFGALVCGFALSVGFQMAYTDAIGYLFQAMLLIALLLPVFRAECLLGFVLGMTFTFGAVLPTLIGGIIAAGSAFVFYCVRPVLANAWAWATRSRSSSR